MKVQQIAICIFTLISTRAAVFDQDDRIERHQIKDQLVRQAARSSAALITKNQLVLDGKNVSYKGKSLKDNLNFCSSAKFANQPMVANCSSVLIGEDLILTAGHCIDESMNFGCEDYTVVFDYVADTEGNIELKKENIYNCKEILYYDFDFMNGSMLDLAILRIDRKVLDRAPIPVDLERPRVGEKVFMVGHPLGIAQKVSQIGEVKPAIINKNSFVHNLDTFSCNSGGPVFSKESGKVVGILVRGSGGNYETKGECRDWFHAGKKDFAEANDLESLKPILKDLL